MPEVYICPECNVWVHAKNAPLPDKNGKVWHQCGLMADGGRVASTMIPAPDPRFVAEVWPGRYLYCPACRRWAAEWECSNLTGHWWHLCGKDHGGRVKLSPAQVIHSSPPAPPPAGK